ncbi:MAG: tetratricopeptide repeat protein [Armatimonas sp.]
MGEDSIWHFSFFGGVRARRGSKVIDHFRSQKFAFLLAYLAIHPSRQHTREELCDLLWPEADLEAARTNLRTALANLRKTFQDELILTQGYTHVQLNQSLFTADVKLFEDKLKQAKNAQSSVLYQEALRLYQGPFLPNCYDSWALTERDRLTEQYLNAAHELSQLLEAGNNLDEALQIARQALSVAPLRDELHGEVIRLLLCSGEAAMAQKHYEDFAQQLEEQLGLEPSPEVQRLLKETKPVTLASPKAPEPAIEQASLPVAPLVQLPTTLTRFFGRDQELGYIQQSFSNGARLLTLTGPAGVGKTRLVIEAARNLAELFPAGVHFVSLVDIREGVPLVEVVLRALGEKPGPMPQEQLLETLSGQRLLIFDNTEHLVDCIARLAAELLARLPELKILITSRVLLLCEGESEVALTSLPEKASVALFANRVQALRPDFQLTETNSNAIARVCTRLEGIPLALELAASHARILSPGQILERLDQRLDFLVNRKRDAAERHQTLRAAIDWSYKMLDPALQQFFAKLSVFRGGWSLEAAEAICQEPLALDYLTYLRECSLIFPEESGATMRYRMLETLREYGQEALRAQGLTPDTEALHLSYFYELGKSLQSSFYTNAQATTIAMLQPDLDNLRAIVRYAICTPTAIPDALDLLHLVHRFWLSQGLYEEYDRAIEQLLEAADTHGVELSLQLRLNVLDEAAGLAFMGDRFPRARQLYEKEQELATSSDDEFLSMNALYGLALLANVEGRYQEARTIQERVLHVWEQRANTYAVAIAYNGLGITLTRLGEYDLAREHLETSLALKGDSQWTTKYAESLYNVIVIEVLNRQWSLATEKSQQLQAILDGLDDNALELENSLKNQRGLMLCEQGEYEAARALVEEAHSFFLERNQIRAAAQCQQNLGRLSRYQGDTVQAEEALHRALETFAGAHDHRRVAECQEQLALLYTQQENYAEATRWLEEADTLRARISSPLPPLDQEAISNIRKRLSGYNGG